MKILYDYQTFGIQKYGGVSLYFYEIITHLPCEYDAILGLKVSRSIYFTNLPNIKAPPKIFRDDFSLSLPLENNRLYVSLRYRWIRFINKRFFRKILLRGDFDVLHITYDLDDWWLPELKEKPFVYTVYDLIPELYGKDCAYLRRRKMLASKAARIIAISENTKKDCIRLWGIAGDKIDVVYLAPSVCDHGGTHVNTLGDYILFVGGRNGYKNFRWFISSIGPILKARTDLKVFCTGAPFSREEKQFLKEQGIATQVHAEFVESENMFNLYQQAKVFVYPSCYEGFGMPILDAFKVGCPVVLSRASCFPEVGGEAALYFDLEDPTSLRKAITEVLDDPHIRGNLVANGSERVKRFSWDQAAAETARVYDRALSHWGEATGCP